jgi:hypothetical protein
MTTTAADAACRAGNSATVERVPLEHRTPPSIDSREFVIADALSTRA